MNWSWTRNFNLKTLYLLLLGQLISIALALSSFSSSFLANLGFEAPIFQACFAYLSLALVNGGILVYRRQKPKVSWHWYLLLGYLNVLATFCYNTAYHLTSITSVAMLDSLQVAWSVMLTWIFLSTQYSVWQIFGATLSVLGIGVLLLSDVGVGGGGGSRPLLGDVAVIAETFFYSLANVGMEFCVKNTDRVEVMCMIGACGFLVSIIHIPILELKSLQSVKFSSTIISALIVYNISVFILYFLFPIIAKKSGATMYCLSILTADMWVVLIRVFFYHQQVNLLFFIAFVMVASGILIYSIMEKNSAQISEVEQGNTRNNYEALTEENGDIKSEF